MAATADVAHVSGSTSHLALSPPARLAHLLVRAYQRVTADRPSPCRFVPTCSSYALDALEMQGFVRGLWLTGRRLARCHPWGGQGWDPVPPRTDRSCRSAEHDHRDVRVVPASDPGSAKGPL